MTPFDEIRERVSARQAAEHYGLPITRNKTNCIWHNDRNPSLSFKDGYCKCFSCGAGGSSIDLVMQLHGLSALEAAKRLNADFALGLDVDAPYERPAVTVGDARKLLDEFKETRKQRCRDIITEATKALVRKYGRAALWDKGEFVSLLQIKAAAQDELCQMTLMDTEDWIETYRQEVIEIGQDGR